MTLLDLQITRKRVVAQGIVSLELRDPQRRCPRGPSSAQTPNNDD